MMGQTMLIRNADGDYSPAHRSLLEFFVAFKFAAELEALAPDFLELAQVKSGIDRSLEPRAHTWSEYFGGRAVAPLKGFVTEKLGVFRSGFGVQILIKAVIEMISPITNTVKSLDTHLENLLVLEADDLSYYGGNIITLMLGGNKSYLEGKFLQNVSMKGADFDNASLRGLNVQNSDLSQSKFTKFIGSVRSTVLSQDPSFTVIGDTNGTIHVLNLDDDRKSFILKGHNKTLCAISLSPNNKTLVSASDDRKILIWDLDSKKSVLNLAQKHITRTLSFSFNGQLIASGDDCGNVNICNSQTGDLIMSLSGCDKAILCIDFNKEDRFVVAGHEDNCMDIYKNRISSILETFNSVLSVKFSPESWMLISGGNDGNIRLCQILNRFYK